MKKLIFIVMLGLSSIGFSGPVIEIYECQINKGKTLEDLSNMMDTFSTYLKKAGLSESYKACLLYTSPSPRDRTRSRMPSSA